MDVRGAVNAEICGMILKITHDRQKGSGCNAVKKKTGLSRLNRTFQNTNI